MSIPLMPAEPSYTAHGRQQPFVESSLQRDVRLDFLKHRDNERVSDWVKGQQASATELAMTIQSLAAAPQPHSLRRRRYIVPPRLRKSQQSLSEPQILFDIPEDADEPVGHREPRIFYSTPVHASRVPSTASEDPLSSEESYYSSSSDESDADVYLSTPESESPLPSPPLSPSHKKHTRSLAISSSRPLKPSPLSSGQRPSHQRRLSDLDDITEEIE